MNIQQQVDKDKQRDNWLASLEAGSEVAIRGCGWGYTPPRIGRVVRTTKTQLIVTIDGQGRLMSRYRRDTGRLVGGSWAERLIEPVPEIRDQIQHTNNLYRLEKIVAGRKTLTPAQVAAMLAAHDEHAPKQ